MLVYRLQRKKYGMFLSGKGAALSGGRWNSKEIEIIYTASNRSLALVEILVNLSYSVIPKDFQMLTIKIPNSTPYDEVKSSDLPSNWQQNPCSAILRSFGDHFIQENKYCLLKVPSAVTKGDFNFLINPNHPKFKEIRLINEGDFPFDKRFF